MCVHLCYQFSYRQPSLADTEPDCEKGTWMRSPGRKHIGRVAGLERLEEQMPTGESRVIKVVFVSSDGSEKLAHESNFLPIVPAGSPHVVDEGRNHRHRHTTDNVDYRSPSQNRNFWRGYGTIDFVYAIIPVESLRH